MARFVECDGATWKLTEASYKKLLKSIASNDDVDINQYGKLIITETEKLSDLQNMFKRNSWHNE